MLSLTSDASKETNVCHTSFWKPEKFVIFWDLWLAFTISNCYLAIRNSIFVQGVNLLCIWLAFHQMIFEDSGTISEILSIDDMRLNFSKFLCYIRAAFVHLLLWGTS